MRKASVAIRTTPGRATLASMGLAVTVIVLLIWCCPARARSAEGPARQEAPLTTAEAHLDKELTLDLGGGVKLELVLVPAGKFMMGSPQTEAKRDSDETQHEVTISRPLYMGRHLVTQEQYEKVTGANPSKFKGAKRPVDKVNWDDAQAFCKKLSAVSGKTVRLPTEAQWEYACRAGSTTAYCFGESAARLAEYAWYSVNAQSTTHAVGQKKPNAWGLCDMHGHLWEWCQDWYGEKYYSESPNVDPQGTGKGGTRVLRGGSWYVSTWDCRSAYRYWGLPGYREPYNGFRVVVTVPQTSSSLMSTAKKRPPL
jgi:formylglycine-generating enzyme required for sulfatase activity